MKCCCDFKLNWWYNFTLLEHFFRFHVHYWGIITFIRLFICGIIHKWFSLTREWKANPSGECVFQRGIITAWWWGWRYSRGSWCWISFYHCWTLGLWLLWYHEKIQPKLYRLQQWCSHSKSLREKLQTQREKRGSLKEREEEISGRKTAQLFITVMYNIYTQGSTTALLEIPEFTGLIRKLWREIRN